MKRLALLIHLLLLKANKRRRLAKRKYGQSILLAELAPQEAEQKGREALALGASAFYWLDGTELGEVTHQELHEWAASSVRASDANCTSPAHPTSKDVPSLSHTSGLALALGSRGTVSARSAAKMYPSVCMSPDCSEHSSDHVYPTRAGTIVTEGAPHEVSIVPKPAHPDARLTAIPIYSAELVEYLGPKFRIGMPVICSQCLGDCAGFTELPSHEGPIDR
jgi:hypothetical protein